MSIDPPASPTVFKDKPALIAACHEAVNVVDVLLATARTYIRQQLTPDGGRFDNAALNANQHVLHGLSWLATYAQALRQMAEYAERMNALARFGALEGLLTQVAFGEYLNQIAGGIPMSQSEFIRSHELGLGHKDLAPLHHGTVGELFRSGNSAVARAEILKLMCEQEGSATVGDAGLDETLNAVRDQMRRFADERIVPDAHQWHLKNDYIPMEIITEMSELGVFGLTIPEEFGGLGLGKESMCVVSEELSRGYIGVGSLGTRSEIAAELILSCGTNDQKNHLLPKLSSGEVLPTAVFTEPNTGSDLASLKARAVLDGDTYRITGNKTWITHPVRADLMTLLVRTNPEEPGYKGLSMLLAQKPRGSDADPFPATGMNGTEIEVLGYRGMKEYEIGFDGFEVPASALLGSTPGEGFKQLMQTFESARIQTAARAIGVAQSALECAFKYAQERIQFGQPILSFPRVFDKIVLGAVEIMLARQLTYFAAREKDRGARCDLEAGMAKLLGARIAWSMADNAVQIHGGNGFALEYPVSRILCDARILSIFEGAAEIQAQVIARRLLDEVN
jgi:(2S)-methylsuccinyl-CoA dehydrogenase